MVLGPLVPPLLEQLIRSGSFDPTLFFYVETLGDALLRGGAFVAVAAGAAKRSWSAAGVGFLVGLVGYGVGFAVSVLILPILSVLLSLLDGAASREGLVLVARSWLHGLIFLSFPFVLQRLNAFPASEAWRARLPRRR